MTGSNGHRPHRTGPVVRLSETTARVLHRMALWVGWVAVAVLAFGAATGALPRNPEGGMSASVQGPAQVALLVVVALGLLAATRRPAVGAVLVMLAGVGLTALAAVEYPPLIAIAVGTAFAVVSISLWVAWQRRERWPAVIGLAVVSTVLLATSWTLADSVYTSYFGPTHPESPVAAVEDPLVRWAWAGGVESGGFTVVARVRDEARPVGLEVHEARRASADLDPVLAVPPVPPVDGRVRFEVEGLASDTGYEYRFTSSDGVDDGGSTSEWVGAVTTFPAEAVADEIVIAAASCARTGSDGLVYDAIRGEDPDLYVITGDLHYENIAANDVGAFDGAYDRVLTSPAQAALYRSVPVAYVWDDHDYSGNDGDGSAASRPAARAAYEANVPSYSLEDDRTIHQAFSVGDVRVVMIDTRSARDPGATMLGGDQLTWLLDELVESSRTHRLVILVSPTPWIDPADPASDAWGAFADERRTIADAMVAGGVDNLVVVGGDAHMVALDDGTNSRFGTAGEPGPPVLQAAALDRPGSVKGGPYSDGTYPGGGQYGLIRIAPEVDGVTEVTLSGHTWDGEQLVTHTFEFTR